MTTIARPTRVQPGQIVLPAGVADPRRAGGPTMSFVGNETSFSGASRTSTQLGNWRPFNTSADADLENELPALVSRSRDLARNNPIAQGVVQTYADNIVGPAFRLVALPDWRALGKTREWAEDWSNGVEALWRQYAETTMIDVARRQTFAEMTITALKSVFLNGAGLALPIWQKERLDKFSTRIFLIEPDRLSNPQDSQDTQSRRGGIDQDLYGRPLGYWIRSTHPGDSLNGLIGAGLGVWERVPAEQAWGRKRVIHFAEIERPGQTRGKPIFAAGMQLFKMLDRYSNAEVDAAATNALVAAFIESPAEMDDLIALFAPEGGPSTDSNAVLRDYLDTRAEPANRARLKSGSIVPLYPGEKLSSFNPGRPSSGYGAFMESTLRHVATSLHIPYELLVKDFSKTNYSSARASMLEAWRFFKGKREWLARNWAKPVYSLWLEEAVNLGLVEAPDFYQNMACYTRSRWIGAARGWVDPVKEANAARIRIEAGLSTMEQECMEQDGDWEEVMEQQAVEMQRRETLGLPAFAPQSSMQLVPAGAQPAAGADGQEPDDEPPATPDPDAPSTSETDAS